MEDHHEPFYPILVVALAGVLVVGSFLLLTPRFIGHVAVSGVGGQMTTLNLEIPTNAPSWMGVYGNLTSNASNATFLLVGGQVIALNLTYAQAFTNETVIVASVNGSPDWLNLSPASLTAVDAFLGLAPADAMSAENTLWELHNFTVDDMVYELWSTEVASANGSYRTGALVSQGSLLFITRPVNGSGFDGSPVDFQVILPVPPGGDVNYTFFVFEQSTYPGEITVVSCDESINLTAVLAADNVSVEVLWDGLVGATSYEVLYVDGPTDGYLNFSNASVVGMGLVTGWLDAAPGAERYYRVRVNDSNSSCVAQETAGTLAQPLSPEYNLVSTPFYSPLNDSVREVLRSIDGDYSEAIMYDNAAKEFRFYLVVGAFVFKNYDKIEPGKGYWIRTDVNTTVRFSGTMAENISEPLSPEYNLVGFPVISNMDQNDTVAYVLSSIDGNYSEAIMYDNAAKEFRFYLVVGAFVFKNYDKIEPGKGYWIRTDVNETLEYVFAE